MALEPVKIPQNVYVEDRIIGPITLRQLIIVGVGCGISYALYSMAAKAGAANGAVTVILWMPGIISFAFAFLKINDLSLFHIILLMIERVNTKNERSWYPHPGITVNVVTSGSDLPPEVLQKKKEENLTKLEVLTKQLEDAQREISALSTQVNPTPKQTVSLPSILMPSAAVEAEEIRKDEETKTLLAQVAAAEQAEKPETEKTLPPLPVNPSRVQTSEKHPTQSIDGLSDLGAFTHLFKR